MADPQRRALLFGTLSVLAPLSLPAQESKAMFKWFPTECAPRAYPMHLVQAVLAFASGGSVDVPSHRDVSNGWGERGSTHILDNNVMPAPARLDVTWFSYPEDRFYKGSFPLPEKSMAGLFQSGVPETRVTHRPAAFERVIVGVAPEGVVSVWMAAAAEVVEVASFLAPPADLPWELVLKNPAISRPEYIRRRLAERLGTEAHERLLRDGIRRGQHQSYRQQYRWSPWVTGSGAPKGVQIRCYNGECSFVSEKGPALRRERRAVPSEVELDWDHPSGTPMTSRISMDEQEAFAAFAKLGRGDARLALHMETSREGVSVSLRDEKFILPFEKAKVQLFRR